MQLAYKEVDSELETLEEPAFVFLLFCRGMRPKHCVC